MKSLYRQAKEANGFVLRLPLSTEFQLRIREFNHFESAFVNTLVLHTKEHRGDVRKHEWLKAFHINAFDVAHLVVTVKHIDFRGDLHVLRVRFVPKRTEDEFTVRTFHCRLIVLRVVRNSRVREQVTLVVLVHKVL